MRPALWRKRRDEDDLLGAGGGDLFEQPRQSTGSIAHAVRLAAPGPFGREGHEVRLGGERHRERGGQRIDGVVAPDPVKSKASAVRAADSPPGRVKKRDR